MADTSTEAVNRLVAGSGFAGHTKLLIETLRALVAERDALKEEVEYLRRWNKAAFLVHPNIDLDMEADPDARDALKGNEQ